MENGKPEKRIYQKWWLWLIIALMLIIASSLGGGDNTGTQTPNETSKATAGDTAAAANTSAATAAATGTQTTVTPETAASAAVNIVFKSGHYTAGTDFPAGVYDIEAVSGGGNVSSGNIFTGGINAIMGTKEKNKEIGTDMYEQKYSNINLDDGVVLSVSGVEIRLTCENASGEPLKPRNQSISETANLGSGNFVAGKDFPAGVYDIDVVSGGGNVSSDNMAGGLNLIMGTKEKNKELGIDMYEQSFQNADLSDGVTLKIDGVKIKLTPSK